MENQTYKNNFQRPEEMYMNLKSVRRKNSQILLIL